MKDFIYSNYNMYINEIFLKNDKQFFFINDYKVYILKIDKEKVNYINNLISLTNSIYNNINVNTFLLNNKNEYLTKYNDNYILLCRVNNIEKDFDLNDIYKFWNIKTNLKDFDILGEWKNEVDELEKKLTMFNKEYNLVQMSVNYYIGMAENAIQLLSDYKDIISLNNDSIGHIMSYKLFSDNNLYDPFIFIKTNRMYDISNYIKYKFLKNDIDYNELEMFFVNGNEYENAFLFSNLLFPSCYFNLINNIFDEKDDEKIINLFIKRRKYYIKLLSFCKKMVKNNKNIKLINWFD